VSPRLDALAQTNRLRTLPPGQKLAFAAALLLLALVSAPMVQLAISIWLLVWVVAYAGIPCKAYLSVLLLPLGFALTSLPAIVINAVGSADVASLQGDVWRGWSQPIGGLTLYISLQGLHQAGVLLSRSLAASSAMFFLLLTTPFNELIVVLRKLGLPGLVLELMTFTYGFIFNFGAIVDDIARAQRARLGYSSRRRSLQSLSLLISQLLQRSLASYRGLAMGLAARGFQGELRLVSCRTHRPSPRHQLEAVAGLALLSVVSLSFPR
jgi:cobalt/nickel transport system permease protein